LVAAAVAAIAARGTYEFLEARSTGATTADRWVRGNYRGRAVSLRAGPALAASALAVVALDRRSPIAVRLAAIVAGGAATLAGVHDDLHGSSAHRGLRGHVVALRHGELTTGALKVLAIGAGGAVAGGLVEPGRWPRRLAAGVVVAGSANLANLLDLRPGRAAKAALIVAVPLAAARGRGALVAAAAGGAAAGLLPLDLGERVMLGDGGANALGAMLGVALIADGGSRRMPVALAVLLGLTAASEVISFSRVIEAFGPLRWCDRLGRLRDS
jgi:UDP-N-acetylmuramyl pentapeptide phosphotransferase/UDP-N-acetylglucosamine-1-phosphate transferase